MVVFIDLDADTVERDFPGHSHFYDQMTMRHPEGPHHNYNNVSHHHHVNTSPPSTASRSKRRSASTRRSGVSNDSDRLNKLFRVVGIYPCIRSIAQHLDRTDLYNLSSTCRDMHQCLLENRRHLLPFTLRCQYAAASQKSKRISSIRSHILRTQCVTDLVNICDRCRRPSCRNCKTRTAKPTHQSTKRATCTACSSISLPSLIVDPTVKPCACNSKGEPWTTTVELECGRGTNCVGKGWYTCENFYKYLDSLGKEETFTKRTAKVRYACHSCKQYMFSKEEEREYFALRA
ncbi:uncharacterized protein DFL_009415 [Arthrobotrys flagrans]|uniref:Uncharacterized protein n=1 Tax=Arthrobotrys flagrans TaxID=97331 RepID=A0A436ZS22_ARTFL|nr:hypothetical protein DFL_009415 [Arthrobotrys flagrans]